MLVRQEGCLQPGPEGTPSLIRSEGLPVNPLITRHQNAQKCTEGPSRETLSLGRYSWTLWAVVPDEQGQSFPSTGLSLPSRARPTALLLKQGQERCTLRTQRQIRSPRFVSLAVLMNFKI